VSLASLAAQFRLLRPAYTVDAWASKILYARFDGHRGHPRRAERYRSRSPGGPSRPASAIRFHVGGSERPAASLLRVEQPRPESSSPTGCSRYPTEMGRPAPEGFRPVRVHDPKHTWGRPFRAGGAGVRGSSRRGRPGSHKLLISWLPGLESNQRPTD
jgi:hypothetical protein